MNGRPVRRFVIEDADEGPEPARLLFTVDDPTDLPLRVEKQHRTRGRWAPRVVVEFAFNQALPEHVFEPGSLTRGALR